MEVRSTKAFHFNEGDASGIEVRSTEAFNLNWAGIEVHRTESRCKAPWIEVRSTEAFNLNWGDAQT